MNFFVRKLPVFEISSRSGSKPLQGIFWTISKIFSAGGAKDLVTFKMYECVILAWQKTEMDLSEESVRKVFILLFLHLIGRPIKSEKFEKNLEGDYE